MRQSRPTLSSNASSERASRDSTVYSSASSTGNEPLNEPLMNPVSASSPSLDPLLYAAVWCEGLMLAEAALIEPSAVPAVRAAASKMERGLQRTVSFCSQDERMPRGAAFSPAPSARRALGLGAHLPSTVTVHTLRRHGHTFIVVTLVGFEAELASRFCEEACAAFATATKAKATQAAAAPPPRPEDGGSTSSSRSSSRRGSRRLSLASLLPLTSSSRQLVSSSSSSPLVEPELDAAFSEQLRALLQQHARPERVARYRRVMEVMAATDEVAGVMSSAVEQIVATSQNLDALEDKSQYLLAQSATFQKTTRELRKEMCWRNCKLSMTLGICGEPEPRPAHSCPLASPVGVRGER